MLGTEYIKLPTSPPCLNSAREPVFPLLYYSSDSEVQAHPQGEETALLSRQSLTVEMQQCAPTLDQSRTFTSSRAHYADTNLPDRVDSDTSGDAPMRHAQPSPSPPPERTQARTLQDSERRGSFEVSDDDSDWGEGLNPAVYENAANMVREAQKARAILRLENERMQALSKKLKSASDWKKSYLRPNEMLMCCMSV